MGCTESKIENEETVNRCRERKQFMERAVTARNKFAAAHSAHAMSLKNCGAALSDFAHGEVIFPGNSGAETAGASSGSAAPPPPLLSYDNFVPPPPPLPSSFTTSSPLQRASTMPEFSIPKPENKQSEEPIIEDESEEEVETELKHRSSKSEGRTGILPQKVIENEIVNPESWDYFFSMENVPGPTLAEVEENHGEREEIERKMLEERAKRREMGGGKKGQGETGEVFEKLSELPPQPPPPEAAMAAAKVVKRGKQGVPPEGKKKSGGGSGVNLVQIFVDLDDCFLKAMESAHEVSRMLEATRLHYHSNFADKRGHINHSDRVMRVITWNRSFRGQLNTDDGMDDFDSEEHETHATVLDKMLAWEKKLYDEVKAGEQMKLEYQKKVGSLNKLKRRGSNMEGLERVKAAVSHLHTRYIVDMQSMDSTVSEINRLRDEQLYPKLVALVDGMATMWETMRIHHESQSKIVQSLKFLDPSQSQFQSPKETTDHHHERTRELGGVVQEWHTNITELMTQQKEYIKITNNWLKLNLVPIDTNLKEKVSSPGRPPNPPIQTLLHAWNDYLDKLPEESARSAVINFAAIIKTIWQYQKEEMDFRNKCADSRKDLLKKTREFENWYNKYMQKRTPPDEETGDKELVEERRVIVEVAKQRLEDDEEAYQKQCVQVRQKSLMTLKSNLPELFRALSDFSMACSDMYRNLKSISHSG